MRSQQTHHLLLLVAVFSTLVLPCLCLPWASEPQFEILRGMTAQEVEAVLGPADVTQEPIGHPGWTEMKWLGKTYTVEVILGEEGVVVAPHHSRRAQAPAATAGWSLKWW